jgi:hypothetical protein
MAVGYLIWKINMLFPKRLLVLLLFICDNDSVSLIYNP